MTRLGSPVGAHVKKAEMPHIAEDVLSRRDRQGQSEETGTAEHPGAPGISSPPGYNRHRQNDHRKGYLTRVPQKARIETAAGC